MAASTLRILCFGDSLTAGYSQYGTVFHPYALEMQKRLAAAFPTTTFEIDDDGAPGQMASQEGFLRRMEMRFYSGHWDWTVVLGGTNDLGWGRPPEQIFSHLKGVWEVPLSKGSKVLALTVPECAVKSETLEKSRNLLNTMIRKHEDDGFYTFDLHAAIPYHSLSEADQQKYWDDGLHLTSAGYDWMGGHIGDALIAILSGSHQPLATKAPRG